MLTPKQKRFVDEYMIDLNATKSAERAGYSKKTANPQGARLLANVSVSEEIKKRQGVLSEKAEIKQEDILNRQNKISQAFELLLELMTKPKRTALEERIFNSLCYTLRAADSTRADEFIAKQLGFGAEHVSENTDIVEINMNIIKKNKEE